MKNLAIRISIRINVLCTLREVSSNLWVVLQSFLQLWLVFLPKQCIPKLLEASCLIIRLLIFTGDQPFPNGSNFLTPRKWHFLGSKSNYSSNTKKKKIFEVVWSIDRSCLDVGICSAVLAVATPTRKMVRKLQRIRCLMGSISCQAESGTPRTPPGRIAAADPRAATGLRGWGDRRATEAAISCQMASTVLLPLYPTPGSYRRLKTSGYWRLWGKEPLERYRATTSHPSLA